MQQVTHKPSFNVAQELGKRFQEALGKSNFPEQDIPDGWFKVAKSALRYASPVSLGCTANEMEALVNTDKANLTMLQFAMLSNNLETKTINEFSQFECEDNYFPIQIETERLSRLWNENTQVLRKQIEQSLINEMTTKEKLEQNYKQMAKA